MAETKKTGMLERLRKVVLSASYVDDIELTDDEADAITLAVLEELREPSKAMIDAGENFDVTVDADGIWQAMINAALAGERNDPREPSLSSPCR